MKDGCRVILYNREVVDIAAAVLRYITFLYFLMDLQSVNQICVTNIFITPWSHFSEVESLARLAIFRELVKVS